MIFVPVDIDVLPYKQKRRHLDLYLVMCHIGGIIGEDNSIEFSSFLENKAQ